MINRNYLGNVSPPTSALVEAGQLKLFNKAIGETRDIYLDEAVAQAAGHRSILASPTFGACLGALAAETGPSFEELGIDYKYVLHGEESFVYHKPIYAGDTITMQTRISDIYDKKDGALEFMVMETTMTNQSGQLVQERRTVLVMRYR